MMLERGIIVDYSTIARWVLTYFPQIDERTRHHLKLNNDSWKVDERCDPGDFQSPKERPKGLTTYRAPRERN